MKIQEIEDRVLKGELRLEKIVEKATKYCCTYSKTKGQWIDVIRKYKGLDRIYKKWLGDVDGGKTVEYMKSRHMAMIDKHTGYKINAKTFNKLVKLLAQSNG